MRIFPSPKSNFRGGIVRTTVPTIFLNPFFHLIQHFHCQGGKIPSSSKGTFIPLSVEFLPPPRVPLPDRASLSHTLLLQQQYFVFHTRAYEYRRTHVDEEERIRKRFFLPPDLFSLLFACRTFYPHYDGLTDSGARTLRQGGNSGQHESLPASGAQLSLRRSLRP